MLTTVQFDPQIAQKLSTTQRRLFRRQISRMVKAAEIHGNGMDWEVAFRFTDDETIHDLNRSYRSVDKPTDVLAFPQQEGPGADLTPNVLGDVVISLDTAAAQAKHGVEAEVLMLAAHGLCHLLGYDHQNDSDEAKMNARVKSLTAEALAQGPVKAA